MSYFGAAHRWGGGKKTPSLGKVTAYPKKIQKIFKSCDAMGSADISIFSSEISTFCYIRNKDVDCILNP